MIGQHDHVREQKRERFVADYVARTPHRMAETVGRLLAHETCRAGGGQRRVELGEEIGLAFLAQRILKLVRAIKIILDSALVAAGDEHDVLDPCAARLVDHVLDRWTVEHRQHFLRHGLGGGQHARSESRHGQDGLANTAGRSGHHALFGMNAPVTAFWCERD